MGKHCTEYGVCTLDRVRTDCWEEPCLALKSGSCFDRFVVCFFSVFEDLELWPDRSDIKRFPAD